MTNFFSYVFDIPTLTQLLIMPMTGLGYVFVNQYSSYSSLLNCLFFGSIDGVLHVQYLDKTYLLVFQKLFMNYCHKLSLSSAVTRKFVGPDDENYIWLEAPWRSWVLIRVSFLPSASTVCPPPAIFLVGLGIRREGMWTAPEKTARPKFHIVWLGE